jgi:hypothetical protein
MAISYRRARGQDFENIVTLQNLYLEANLGTEQKQDGFLSGQFTSEQFRLMDLDGGVVVAVAGDESNAASEVKAYLCASSQAFNMSFALPRAMIESFPQATYKGRPLSEQNLLIAGPVCVDSAYRGQGVVGELYSTLFALVPNLYEVVVVFVSLDNPRSISAHAKLGMNEVSTFCFNEKEYVIMACSIS